MYLVGGNFLEDHARPGQRASRPAARAVQGIHQDIQAQHLDARRRRGAGARACWRRRATRPGGTSTSTERRRFVASLAIADPDGGQRRRGARRVADSGAHRPRAQAGPEGALRLAVAGRRGGAEDGRVDAAKRRHRGADRRRAAGAAGGARLGGTGFLNMPDGRARFSTVPIPMPAPPEGTIMLAATAPCVAAQLDHPAAEDPDHGVGAPRCRALPCRRSRRARARRRRPHPVALGARHHGRHCAHRPLPPPARAGLLARVQRAPDTRVRSGVGRAGLQRRHHRRAGGDYSSNFSCCVSTARFTPGRSSSAFADARIFGPIVRPNFRFQPEDEGVGVGGGEGLAEDERALQPILEVVEVRLHDLLLLFVVRIAEERPEGRVSVEAHPGQYPCALARPRSPGLGNRFACGLVSAM